MASNPARVTRGRGVALDRGAAVASGAALRALRGDAPQRSVDGLVDIESYPRRVGYAAVAPSGVKNFIDFLTQIPGSPGIQLLIAGEPISERDDSVREAIDCFERCARVDVARPDRQLPFHSRSRWNEGCFRRQEPDDLFVQVIDRRLRRVRRPISETADRQLGWQQKLQSVVCLCQGPRCRAKPTWRRILWRTPSTPISRSVAQTQTPRAGELTRDSGHTNACPGRRTVTLLRSARTSRGRAPDPG